MNQSSGLRGPVSGPPRAVTGRRREGALWASEPSFKAGLVAGRERRATPVQTASCPLPPLQF